MRIFPPQLDVSLEEGFSVEKDLFGRAPIAQGLTRIVSSVDQPLVMAIDGDWGSGKTTFLRFWTGELRKAGFPVVFFDAFQNDYANDAFIALSGEVFAALEAQKKNTSEKARTFAKKAVGASKVLLRSSLKIGVKAATFGALNLGDFDDLAGAVSDEAAEVIDDHIGELITQQAAHREAISEFKSALSQLPKALAPESGGDKPLIFIIDELDRCRPTFALELLERVKHFFSVPNVHFVLGINSAQLASSVKAIHGPDIDARTYLQKFFHLSWTLDQRERHARDRSRSKYVQYLLGQYEFKGDDFETMQYSSNFLKEVAERLDLSFRAIERIFALIALAVATTPENHLRIPPILSGLAIIKIIEPSVFAKAKRGKLSYKEVVHILKLDMPSESDDDLSWDKDWWQFATEDSPPQELISRMEQGLFRYSIRNRLDVVPHTADAVMDNVMLRPPA